MANVIVVRRVLEIGAILLLLYVNVNAFDLPDFESDSDSYERPHIWSSLLEEWSIKYDMQKKKKNRSI